MAMINTAELLTSTEAGEALALSSDTIKKYCQSGKLDGLKLGREWLIPKTEVRRYKKERQAVGRPPKRE